MPRVRCAVVFERFIAWRSISVSSPGTAASIYRWCDSRAAQLVVRTDEGKATVIRPLTLDAFVDVYTGARETFSFGDHGCVSRVMWPTSAGHVTLEKVE